MNKEKTLTILIGSLLVGISYGVQAREKPHYRSKEDRVLARIDEFNTFRTHISIQDLRRYNKLYRSFRRVYEDGLLDGVEIGFDAGCRYARPPFVIRSLPFRGPVDV